MKAWGVIELASIAIVSTGHMTEEDALLLTKKKEGRQHQHSEDDEHWSNSVHVAMSEYAYVFSVSSLANKVDNGEDLPEWLHDAYRMCRDIGVLWLIFEQDGMEVKGLPTYDW